MTQAQAVRALAAISKLIRSPEIRTPFKAPFCFQASRYSRFVGSSVCLKTTVDSKKSEEKRKGKVLQFCGTGLATGRGWRSPPTDQTAVFVPIWDLLTNVLFCLASQRLLLCTPSQQLTATVSRLRYSPVYWRITY